MCARLSLPLRSLIVVRIPSLPQRFSAVTSGNGFMWIVGGDQNSNGTMQYSWFNSTWTTVATVPWWAVNYTAPVVAWAGGNLFLTGGAVYGIATNTIWQARYDTVILAVVSHALPELCWLDLCFVFCSTTSGRIASWNIVPNPILAPPPRYGHSLPILDGYAFMIGTDRTAAAL